MDNLNISPLYRINLIRRIETILQITFNDDSQLIEAYLRAWQEVTELIIDVEVYDFELKKSDFDFRIYIFETLEQIKDNGKLFKIAADLGISTPYYIPCTPLLINELTLTESHAKNIFEKAIKEVEENPSAAIGFANSALESILKDLIKTSNLKIDYNPKETTYTLITNLFKVLKEDEKWPKDVNTILRNLNAIAQCIDDLRSQKSIFHGKTNGDEIITDKDYAYLIINSVSTIGYFLLNIIEKTAKLK